MKIEESIPAADFGTLRLNPGIVAYSAFSRDPSWMASKIYLVALRLILFPTPYFPPVQPVFMNQT
jgi:hypothetical protein